MFENPKILCRILRLGESHAPCELSQTQNLAPKRPVRSSKALPNAKILRFCSIARVLLYFPRYFGTWRSLVARLLWEQDVAGSNPVVPTMNLGCEPCRAITFGRARLSLIKKLTENKELSADLQVTNRCHLVCAETTKAPAPRANPKLWDSRCRQTQQTLLRLGGPCSRSRMRSCVAGTFLSVSDLG